MVDFLYYFVQLCIILFTKRDLMNYSRNEVIGSNVCDFIIYKDNHTSYKKDCGLFCGLRKNYEYFDTNK